MLPKEIIQQVRRIEIRTSRFVDETLAGEYSSVFKGRGMEFSDVREYQYGDDIRTIDWNVTGRTGRLHVKQFVEERELTVILLADASGSQEFGTRRKMKGEVTAELCALLAFSAIRNNDRVGLIIFTDRVEKYIPPKKGKQHVLRVIRELLYFKPSHRGTGLRESLEFLIRVLKKTAVAFLVSDFYAPDYLDSLKIAAKKYDLIAVRIFDSREMILPRAGFLELEDAETGERCTVDTNPAGFRKRFADHQASERAALRKLFQANGVDLIEIDAAEPYDRPIIEFFKKREARQRH